MMTISLLSVSAFAQSGLSNFQKTLTYKSGQFGDVVSSDWYTYYVYDQNAVKQLSAGAGITAINFVTDASGVYIKAGSRFEIYGVKK